MRMAQSVMGLPERFSIRQLKARYRKLMKNTHPDINREGEIDTHLKSVELIDSYRVLLEYCENYPVSIDGKGSETPEDFMGRRFGDDPMWK